MHRKITGALFASAILAFAGGCHGPGGSWLDGWHYPFSCPRCPYYDYHQGQWQMFRFGTTTAMETPVPTESIEERAAKSAEQRPTPPTPPSHLDERYELPPVGAGVSTEALWGSYHP